MNPSSILCVAALWIADTGVEPNLRQFVITHRAPLPMDRLIS